MTDNASQFSIGDAVYCLVGHTTVLALGVVADVSSIDAGTLDGYDSSAFWRKAENVNADLLDGIDSGGFLRRQVAGSDAVWWGKTAAYSGGPAGVQTVAHPLGRVPACILVVPNYDADANVDGGPTSTQFGIRWRQAVVSATAYVLLIG